MARRMKPNGDDEPPQNVIKSGGNLAPLKREIKLSAEQVIALKAKRTAITAEINDIKTALVPKGVSKRAFNRALADLEMQRQEEGGDEKVREVAEAYWIAREAMGLSGQPGLFDEDGKAPPPPQGNGEGDATLPE